VDRLSRLVSALLDVTRIANGRAVLEREVCDLADVVRDVVQRLGEEARRAGSELELRAITPAVGWFDPLRVDQVVTNLVSNAIRYGGGQPIQVALEKEGRVVRILVEDRGCGIAPEHLDRLFGRFQRFHAVSAPGGLGLGLYISRHIARAHGGDIHVRSEPGKGSCFTVELPGEVPPDSSSDDAGGQ
jgi:signal transduction histidine kinase